MKINYLSVFSLFLFLGTLLQFGCKDDEQNMLTVNENKVEFLSSGGETSILLQTDADSWSITNPASDWLILSSTGGKEKSKTLKLSVTTKTITPRVDTLIITAGNADPLRIIVSQPAADYVYSLTSDFFTLSFKKAGNDNLLNITTDAAQWTISANADWLQFSPTTGSSGKTAVRVTAAENSGTASRSAVVTISAEYAQPVSVAVSQNGTVSQLPDMYPNYNTSPLDPDITGMNSTATEIAAKIKLGWNIGNTMEAYNNETAWGNPKVTKELIDLVKKNGFNAIRIPCVWNLYLANSTTAELKLTWLNRVKEVVQYCVDNEMYVLLNMHYDGGWLDSNCTADKQVANNAKLKAFWEQIATHLRGFDEHLLFAGTNEPIVKDASQMAVLETYHQTFVDAVRSTGGRNSYRVLAVQGPSTDIEKTNHLMHSLPSDLVANRLMVEVHYYTPSNFCIITEDASWGKMVYYWGKDFHSKTDTKHNATWGEEAAVDSLFKLMKNQFVDKGIPVILGEYGAVRRAKLTGNDLTLHLASRAHYYKYITQQARANGLLPFYWDAGVVSADWSGLFDRTNNTIFDKQALDALLQGAGL